MLRFSGHHGMHDVAELAASGSWIALLALGALKAVALALALSSGWRGGEFFPIVFAGAAAGGAAAALVPGLDVSAALVAGLAAAAAVALAKPLAVLLICVLMFPGVDLGPLLVGLALGMVLLRTVPLPAAHDEDAGSPGS
ncbi:chloride channel protein [Brachybacterium squillarum]|uniref:chloride channel protein n=1 Tax=Brachybacterium squillarum TaxID=661979 RepID=UPI00026293DA|nr:chloride channel protein [Brachybacterium squillarum]